MSASDPVIAAVPRGTLMGKSLDLLEAIGYDVAEVRENDRKLYFEKQNLITMRPSDVPTYVEHGGADLGVVGLDTLLEHSDDLASCGLNVPRLDNVRRTVDFALEMRRIINRFNGETGNTLRLRAGIDTGTVSTGLVGKSNLAYDMWGSAVNLAYQVQSGSPQPGVYVTARVFDAMQDTREFAPAGVITNDGVEEPIWQLAERQP